VYVVPVEVLTALGITRSIFQGVDFEVYGLV